MLTKAQIKHIRALTQQKYRKEHNQFVAEGDKIVREWLENGSGVRMIIGLEEWVGNNMQLIARHPEAAVYRVPDFTLAAVSSLQAPNQALLVLDVPEMPDELPLREWSIALDGIQDPGNMGTIIRIADWFGIGHVVCSPGCVDIYNPKVVQASMGSHLRIAFHKTELSSFLDNVKIPVLAATLHGQSLHSLSPLDAAVLLIGNESQGLSGELTDKASHPVTIPGKGGAESLNAAVSAGILCAFLTPR